MASKSEVKSGKEKERGAVLIVVMWLILAIGMLAASFSASIRIEVDAARNVVDQKQSFYLARAGIEYAVYRLMEAQSVFFQSQQALGTDFAEVPEILTGHLSLKLTGGSAEVDVLDETGKLNVNHAPDYMLFNLLLMVGVDESQADVITDSVMDWVDPDDLIRPFGAESDYYLTLKEPYRAKNGAIDVPEELLLIQGITPEIYYGVKRTTPSGDPVEYYGLQKYVTTFGYSTQINANSAPVPVLAAVPGLDYDLALMIDQMRREMPLTNPTQIAEAIPGLSSEAMNHLVIMRSDTFTIESTGRLENSKVVSRIRTVIQLGNSPKGYGILYWNESNLEL